MAVKYVLCSASTAIQNNGITYKDTPQKPANDDDIYIVELKANSDTNDPHLKPIPECFHENGKLECYKTKVVRVTKNKEGIRIEFSEPASVPDKIKRCTKLIENQQIGSLPTGIYNVPDNWDKHEDYMETTASPMDICFAAALATKGFVVLGGLSGAGKTKMAKKFADAVVYEEKKGVASKDNVLVMPVRPDWRDGKSVLGYYNALAEDDKKLQKTNLGELLVTDKTVNTAQSEASPYNFAIFDEMNLARVEYYLADILSAMELRDDGVDFDFGDGTARTLKIPRNLFIVGTANMDETTFAFSPKVLDRSFYIRFKGSDMTYCPPPNGKPNNQSTITFGDVVKKFLTITQGGIKNTKEVFDEMKNSNSGIINKVETILCAINDLDGKIAFGYRPRNEMCVFIQNYCGIKNEQAFNEDETATDTFNEALAWAVLTKVLPKFHGAEEDIGEVLYLLAEKLETESGLTEGTKIDKGTKKVRDTRPENNIIDRVFNDIAFLQKELANGYATYC